MAGKLAAVLGTGQTKYVAKRQDVSMNGLVREAIDRALADSGSTFDDIDAVVVGKAPDFFEGVMMPELFMADAMGATGKPLIRVHTAGSVGGSTGVVAASLVQSGKYRRVLALAWEKQSESNAMWALSIPVPFTKPVGAGAGGCGQGPAQRQPQPVGTSAAARHHPGEGDGISDALGSNTFR